jgi:anti-sigma B factor antagonist
MTEYRYLLSGEIDIDNASHLRADLARAIETDGTHLLVDCSQLTFIDSTGVAVLLEANSKLEANGRHMLLVNVTGGPRLVFEALGLTNLLRNEHAAGGRLRADRSKDSVSWG